MIDKILERIQLTKEDVHGMINDALKSKKEDTSLIIPKSLQQKIIKAGKELDFKTFINNLNTNGTITAGAITYPNVDGAAGQVLSTTGSGTLTWTTGLSNDMKLNRGSNKPSDIVSVNTSTTVFNTLVTSNSIILLTTQNGVAGSSGKYPAVVHNKQDGSFEIHHN